MNTSTSSQHPAPLAIVTGASSGIGKATAIVLARRGYRTLLIARREDRLRELAAQLSEFQPSFALPLDLGDAAIIEPALSKALSEHGPADVLINNAGWGICKPMLEQSLEDHQRIMQVHYFAAVQMIHATFPTMLKRGKGHIINVASMSTKMGPWGHAAYAAAKCALVSLTQTMSMDYADQGVNFSYVNPGIIYTEFYENPGYDAIYPHLMKRGITAEAVARVIFKLLKKPRLEACVPRIYRIVDLFKAISPGLARRIVMMESRPQS